MVAVCSTMAMPNKKKKIILKSESIKMGDSWVLFSLFTQELVRLGCTFTWDVMFF